MSNKEKKLSDKWFDQWVQTDSYLASDNHINRIPLRLTSSNIVIYLIKDMVNLWIKVIIKWTINLKKG